MVISPLVLYRLVLSSPSPVLAVSFCANQKLSTPDLRLIKSSPFLKLALSVTAFNRYVSSWSLILVIRWTVSSINSGLVDFGSRLCSVLPSFSRPMARCHFVCWGIRVSGCSHLGSSPSRQGVNIRKFPATNPAVTRMAASCSSCSISIPAFSLSFAGNSDLDQGA